MEPWQYVLLGVMLALSPSLLVLGLILWRTWEGMMAKKTPHPMDGARDAALATIQKIADRALRLYAEHDVRIDRQDILMDITSCHFTAGQRLRLDDLLAADDVNFLHDVAGINRHLNRETGELMNCFSPRFSHRREAA